MWETTLLRNSKIIEHIYRKLLLGKGSCCATFGQVTANHTMLTQPNAELGKTTQEVLDKFLKMDFYVGGHKAYLWCQSLLKAYVIVVSDGLTYVDAALIFS